MPACKFRSEDTSFVLKDKRLFTQWIHQIIREHQSVPGDLVFIFCSDKFLLHYNINFLNHHTLTDIITFDYTIDNKISGDILISADRVRENATSLDLPFQDELSRVMIHGVLHLLGYRDKKPSEKKKMRQAEDAALVKLSEIPTSKASQK